MSSQRASAHVGAPGRSLYARVHRSLTRVLVAVLATLLATTGIILGSTQPAAASFDPASSPNSLDIPFQSTGTVNAMAKSGTIVYLGGDFTFVGGVARNRVAAVDVTNDTITPFNPNVNGTVEAIALDSTNGVLYIGGTFTTVSGSARQNIASIDVASGTLTPWNPGASASVLDLQIDDVNNQVYVGGTFTTLGGLTRNRIGSFALGNATPTAWNPNASTTVRSIALDTTNSVAYVGGDFTTIGGQTRNRIASFAFASSAASVWNPNADNIVRSLAIDPTSANILVAGDYANIGGQARARLAAITIAGATATTWNPAADNTVNRIVYDDSSGIVYVGGAYTTLGGQSRNNLGALSTASSTAIQWAPSTDAAVRAILVDVTETRVYVGGSFNTLSSAPRDAFGYLPAAAPVAVQSPMIEVGGITDVFTFALDGNNVFYGGSFTYSDQARVLRIAKADLTTGDVDPAFAPNPNNVVRVMAFDSASRILYVGGDFTIIGGVTRNRLAAIDVDTGAVTSWNPNANGVVRAMVLDSATNRLYVGGDFTALGATARLRVGALDLTTASAAAWTPASTGADNPVHALALSTADNTLFIGGTLTSAGGSTRNRAAAFATDTGALRAWNPNFNSTVSAIAHDPVGDRVFVGGSFNGVNSVNGTAARNRIASVNDTAGTVTIWNPNAALAVRALQWDAANSRVLVAGDFTTIGGGTRNRVAELDPASNLAGDWNPGATGVNGIALTLLYDADNARAYLGGQFTTAAGGTRYGLASVTAPNVGTGALESLKLDTTSDAGATFNISATARDDNILYVTGNFLFINGVERTRLGAVDLNTNIVTSLNQPLSAAGLTLAVDTVNDKIYVGGSFTTVGVTARNRIARIDQVAGTLDAWNPNAGAAVRALLLDGATLYVGGDFTSMGAVTRRRIGAVDLTTGANTAWVPGNQGLNGNVHSLAKDTTNNRIIAGGAFTATQSPVVTRNRIAAFDMSTGNLSSWDPNANGQVNAVAYDSGSDTVFAGGSFTSAGGQPRNRVVKLDNTGVATAWDINANGTVQALAVDATQNALYVGGDFTTVSLVSRTRLVAANLDTGTLSLWSPGATLIVRAVNVDTTLNEVIAAGDFGTIAGIRRTNVVRMNGVSSPITVPAGTLIPIATNLSAAGSVNTMVRANGVLYVGGGFTHVAGQRRFRLAAVDIVSNALTNWNPGANGIVRSIAFDSVNDRLLVGGEFTQIAGVFRNRLAALDRVAATTTSWNPNVANTVRTVAIDQTGGTVYFGGDFSGTNQVNGATSRNRLAAVSLSTGTVTTWNPNANNVVRAISLDVPNNLVYIAGDFNGANSVNGTTLRNRFASVGLVTGTVTAWDPNANGVVRTLALDATDDKLIVGGDFTTMGGSGRARVASFTLSTGILDSWNPTADAQVNVVMYDNVGDRVYVGGTFANFGGSARARVGSVPIGSNTATAFNPSSDQPVTALDLGANSLYLGGAFTTVGGSSRTSMAAFGGAVVPINSTSPSITGTPQQAQVLTAVTGTWLNSPTFYTYQWRQCDNAGANCADIASATAATYTLVVGNVDRTIRVVVTANNGDGPSLPATTAATAIVTPPDPAAPTLAGTSGDTQVVLNWNTVSGAASYNVYRDAVFITNVAVTSYTDTGRTNGTAYAYVVRTVDAYAQLSVNSNTDNVTPLPPILAAPTGLSATAGDTQVGLTWTAVAGASSYKVFLDAVLVGSPTVANFTNIGLTNGTSYAFTVRAVDAFAQDGTLSGSVSATPLPPVPGAPTGLGAVAANTQVSLSWTPVAGAVSYDVYRDNVLLINVATTSYLNTSLTNGTSYAFKVRAIDVFSQQSSDSSTVSATPLPPLLGAPTGFSATAGDTQVVLNWNTVSDASSYKVYRDGVLVGSPTGTTFTNTGLTNGTIYAFTVRAVDSFAQDGTLTGAVNATPLPPVPGVPTGVTATAGDAQVTVNWTAVSGAASYDVFQDGVLVINVATASYLSTGLANGTIYAFKVQAVDAFAQRSADSSIATARPLPPPLAAPVSFSATPGDTQVVLSWTAVAGAASHGVFRDAVLVGTPVGPSFTSTGLTNGTSYAFTVRAIDAFGQDGALTSAASATPLPPLPATPALGGTSGDTVSNLSWNTIAGATSYRVYRDASLVATPSGTTFSDTGRTNGTSYAYVVRAVDAFTQQSVDSNTVNVTPLPPVPTAPTGVALVVRDSTLAVTWPSVTTATAYIVFVNGVAVGTPAFSPFEATGLANGTEYAVTVSANNLGGTSALSTAVRATPIAAPALAPTTTTTGSGTTATVQWTAVASSAARPVTGYELEIDGTIVGTFGTSTFTEVVNNLNVGRTATFKVRAVNVVGPGPWSNTATYAVPSRTANPNPGVSAPPATVLPPAVVPVDPPAVPIASLPNNGPNRGDAGVEDATTTPSQLTGLRGELLNDRTIELSWDRVEDDTVTGIEIRVKGVVVARLPRDAAAFLLTLPDGASPDDVEIHVVGLTGSLGSTTPDYTVPGATRDFMGGAMTAGLLALAAAGLMGAALRRRQLGDLVLSDDDDDLVTATVATNNGEVVHGDQGEAPTKNGGDTTATRRSEKARPGQRGQPGDQGTKRFWSGL